MFFRRGEANSPQEKFFKALCTLAERTPAGVTFAHIDSHFNVLGCGVAKDFSKMGNIAHCSFEEAWTSEQAEKVRNALVPLCRKIIAP
jgi:MoaA/NifB/PqqE/SkfB family radical SAM enzyme